MASTNKTTNYELSQFIETDRPAWLTDYNSDMRKIDSNLKEVSDIAGGASGSISALADRMSAAEGNITTNANDIDALEARADSLEAQAQSTAGTIANIQTEQTAQNLGIEAATELGYNLARPYDSASTYAVGDYVLFQNTLYKCITAVPVGEAFDATKWLAIKATDEISAGGYTLPTASPSTLGGVKIGEGITITDGVISLSPTETYTNSDVMTLSSSTFSMTASHLRYIKNKLNNILIGDFTITNDSLGTSVNVAMNFNSTSNFNMPTGTIYGMGTAYGVSVANSINVVRGASISGSNNSGTIFINRGSVNSQIATQPSGDTTFTFIFIW